MNDRMLGQGQDHSKTPINDSLPANFNNLNNLSAVSLNANQPAQNDNKPASSDESNILVAIRIRPLLPKELMNQELDIIREEGNLLVAHYDYLSID